MKVLLSDKRNEDLCIAKNITLKSYKKKGLDSQ
jgi:hypothetical protein